MDFKQKISELKEKIFSKETQTPIGSVMEYKERIRQHKKKVLINTVAAAAGVLFLIGGAVYLIETWNYSGYSVVAEAAQEDTISTKYTEFGYYILKYGGDEISLLDRQGEALWNSPQTMENPMVDICGEC